MLNSLVCLKNKICFSPFSLVILLPICLTTFIFVASVQGQTEMVKTALACTENGFVTFNYATKNEGDKLTKSLDIEVNGKKFGVRKINEIFERDDDAGSPAQKTLVLNKVKTNTDNFLTTAKCTLDETDKNKIANVFMGIFDKDDDQSLSAFLKGKDIESAPITPEPPKPTPTPADLQKQINDLKSKNDELTALNLETVNRANKQFWIFMFIIVVFILSLLAYIVNAIKNLRNSISTPKQLWEAPDKEELKKVENTEDLEKGFQKIIDDFTETFESLIKRDARIRDDMTLPYKIFLEQIDKLYESHKLDKPEKLGNILTEKDIDKIADNPNNQVERETSDNSGSKTKMRRVKSSRNRLQRFFPRIKKRESVFRDTLYTLQVCKEAASEYLQPDKKNLEGDSLKEQKTPEAGTKQENSSSNFGGNRESEELSQLLNDYQKKLDAVVSGNKFDHENFLQTIEEKLSSIIKPSVDSLRDQAISEIKEKKELLAYKAGSSLTTGGIIQQLQERNEFEKKLKSFFVKDNTAELGDKALIDLLNNREENLRLALNESDAHFLDLLDLMIEERENINETITHIEKSVNSFQGGQHNARTDMSLDERVQQIIEIAKQAEGNENTAKHYKDELEKISGELEQQGVRLKSIMNHDLEIASNLVAGFLKYLNFDSSADVNQGQPKIEDYKNSVSSFLEEKLEFRRFKIRLSQGVQALKEALDDQNVTGRTDVMEALNINEINSNLGEFFSKIKKGHDQWNNWDYLWKIILSGFTDNSFLHNLFRADRLLETYFSNSKEFYKLKNAINACANAFESILSDIGVELYEVALLEPPSEQIKFIRGEGHLEKIRNVPEIRKLIHKKRKKLNELNINDDKFVVDITFFGFSGLGVENVKVDGVQHSPSQWTEKQSDM